MPQLAVVSYPILDEADRRWVESIRASHDPQAARLAAHFTLVFPADVPLGEVAVEVAAVARSTAPIRFIIRRAKPVRDTVGDGGHVFLVPDEGAHAIATLHDQLYRGVLRPHLRKNVPFVPHITVAAALDFSRCEALVQDLNRNARTLGGVLESVELVDVAGTVVSSTERFVLVDR
jgi:2'-5' RNA ligase